MTRPVLTPSTNVLRARLVLQHCRDAGIQRIVLFSCGNAAKALRDCTGMMPGTVTEIGPQGDLQPGPRAPWWTTTDIARVFHGQFDATCGHLPSGLMALLADTLREELGPLMLPEYDVPTGSGETIVCLAMAYPNTAFHAVYSHTQPDRAFSDGAPLNALVRAVAASVRWDA